MNLEFGSRSAQLTAPSITSEHRQTKLVIRLWIKPLQVVLWLMFHSIVLA